MMRALAALLYLVAALLALPLAVGFVDAIVYVLADRTLTGLDWSPPTGRFVIALALAFVAALAGTVARTLAVLQIKCRHQWSDSHYIYRVGWFRRCERCGHAEMTNQPDRPSHWSARLAPSYERPPAPPAPPPVKEA